MPEPLALHPLVRKGLIAAAILAAALATYYPALHGGILWDDDAHLTNHSLRSLYGLWQIWSDPTVRQQYYPLMHSAFWFQAQLWGDATLGYHVVNVLFHVANGLLVWAILSRLNVPGALLAAAIFIFHPVHVESVAWMTELKNTLSGFFYLTALWCYLPLAVPQAAAHPPIHTDKPPPWAWRRYAYALVFFVFALLTKTVTASLPAAILLIVWWKLGRIEWRRHVLPLLPFFVLGIASGLMTAWFEKYFNGAIGEEFHLTWLERTLIAGRVVWFYAGKIVWPAELIFIYPRWTIDTGAWWWYAYGLGAVALLAAAWALRHRIGRGPLAALLFFGGTLFPALGFVDVYPFLFSFVADHFQYLASLGIIALLAAGATLAARRVGWDRTALKAAAVVLVVVLAQLSWKQSHIYIDAPTLYRDTIARNPDCFLAHNNLGFILNDEGRYEEAIVHFKEAVRAKPDYVLAYSNMGNSYARLNRLNEAAETQLEALRHQPYDAVVWLNLGLVRAKQGRLIDAENAWQNAVAYSVPGGHIARSAESLLAQLHKSPTPRPQGPAFEMP